jgi:hypothetical protein
MAAQARVRNRASIMARHMFGDEGDGFAHAQVASLLHSLNIAAHEEPWPAGGFHPTPLPTAALADTAAQWAHAFQRDSAVAPRQPQQQTRQHEGGWVEEFATQRGDWVAQFHQHAALPPALVRVVLGPHSSGKAAQERQATKSATMQGPKWCRRLAFGGLCASTYEMSCASTNTQAAAGRAGRRRPALGRCVGWGVPRGRGGHDADGRTDRWMGWRVSSAVAGGGSGTNGWLGGRVRGRDSDGGGDGNTGSHGRHTAPGGVSGHQRHRGYTLGRPKSQVPAVAVPQVRQQNEPRRA